MGDKHYMGSIQFLNGTISSVSVYEDLIKGVIKEAKLNKDQDGYSVVYEEGDMDVHLKRLETPSYELVLESGSDVNGIVDKAFRMREK